MKPRLGFAVTDTAPLAQTFVEGITLSYLWPTDTEPWHAHQWFSNANLQQVSILAAIFLAYRLLKKPWWENHYHRIQNTENLFFALIKYMASTNAPGFSGELKGTKASSHF